MEISIWNSTEQFTENWNSSVVPAGCIVIKDEEFIPWKNPHNVVSYETEAFVRKLKDLFFLPAFFLIGCPANVINMVVFFKQGLTERINVLLFALSLADELYILFNMMLYGEQIWLQVSTKEMYGPVMRTLSNHNMFGLYGFTYVSQVMSAVIACDRCFCILRPFHSQTIVRTSTTTTITVVIYVICLGLFFLAATRYRIACMHDPASDSSVLLFVPSEVYYQHKLLVDSLDLAVFGGVLPFTVIVVVVVTTIITTVKLRQAASWRAETSSGGLSQAEIALTKMLVINSVFFLACVIPLGSFRLLFFILPEMNPSRRQHNFHMMFKWILVVISYINSTFNFVIYYTMGSRYRQTFWQLFGRKSTSTSPATSNTSLITLPEK